MNTLTHSNPHIPAEPFEHLMTVEEPPPSMVSIIGRHCYLKLQTGMSNPHAVSYQGHLVAPAWDEGANNPTDQPRLFQIRGLQKNYKGDVCYRIYAQPNDRFGRCASPSEILILEA